jgi:solute carrier family 13 (sodium-dependent dicarboxylate transporter), member 2/3/5
MVEDRRTPVSGASRAVDLVAPLSEAEARFESVRGRVGLILAPVLFLSLLVAPISTPSPEAHRLAAVLSAIVVLWITEALPIPVTALLGAALCVVLQVAPAQQVFAPFADPLMFLFIGSFILARAIFFHHLDRRLAFGVLSIRWVGARPSRILFAFGAVTTFISAWISNTATTAMMFAIGLSILSFLFEKGKSGGPPIRPAFATGMMLITSFGASIGGLATPVGTAPNLIGLGLIRKLLDVEFPFFRWTLIGVPVVICLFLYLFWYLNYFCNAGVSEINGMAEMLENEKASLGPWTQGQRSTCIAFLVTIVLWIVPGLAAILCGNDSEVYKWFTSRIPESVAAIIGALLLFLLPGDDGKRAISWDEAARIDWGVVLLYGGGFTLGVLSFQTGLADAIGRGLTGLLPIQGGLGLLIASTLVAALVSETTSNTASANMVVPVVIGIAKALDADAFEPALGATFGASLGFMLPVSTPCNAIVYGSGYIPLSRMIRYGVLLDVVGVIVIVTAVHLLAPILR